MRDITLQELLEAGCHFGHQVRRWNPAMARYIYGVRDNVHIFDLAKTREGLISGAEFLKKVAARGGVILYVGTKRQASEMVKAEAIRAGMPYVDIRWMGGMLTNFEQLSRRIKRLADLKSQKLSGELKRYTKKEQLLFDREIAKLEKFFGGVTGLNKIPDAMFVVDTHKEDVAIREAKITKVPVVGMVDTNGSDENIEHVIAINDDAAKSVELVLNFVTDGILEGKLVNSSEFIVHSDEETKKTDVIEKSGKALTEEPEKKKVAKKAVSKKVKKDKTE